MFPNDYIPCHPLVILKKSHLIKPKYLAFGSLHTPVFSEQKDFDLQTGPKLIMSAFLGFSVAKDQIKVVSNGVIRGFGPNSFLEERKLILQHATLKFFYDLCKVITSESFEWKIVYRFLFCFAPKVCNGDCKCSCCLFFFPAAKIIKRHRYR